METIPGDGSPLSEGALLDGKYRVEHVLGRGGTGVLVSAFHEGLGHRVAIKFLRQDICADIVSVDRFTREARAAVKVRGEHVARIIDVGTLATGGPYIVMEYLEGRDLSVELKERGRLPLSEAVDYLLQACDAVAEAHSLGIVHRDLKPANLFLCRAPDGAPLIKVLDFGISKSIGAAATAARQTNPLSMIGSPLYMAPEQARGSGSVDGRVDVWSLGVLFYELVAGRPPFEFETVASLLVQIASDVPIVIPPSPHVPEGIQEIVARCLEKDVELRMPDVSALARALAPFAPPAARQLVDRVNRYARQRSNWPTSATSSSEYVAAGKSAEWRKPRAGRRRNLWRVAALLGLGAAIGAAASLLPHESTPKTAQTPAICNNDLIVAKGTDGLVDDFEDDNWKIPEADGRSGEWMDWSSLKMGLIHHGETLFERVRLKENQRPTPQSLLAAHFLVRGFQSNKQDLYAGFGLRLVGEKFGCYDVSKYTGLSFWAKGHGRPLSVQFATEATLPATPTEQGDCNGTCYDHFQLPIELTPEWTFYRVAWSQLKQGGWGVRSKFDLRELVQISFDVDNPGLGDTEFFVDDVRLLTEPSTCDGEHTVARGESPEDMLVDDFEDKDLHARPVDGRRGDWLFAGDSGGKRMAHEVASIGADGPTLGQSALVVAGEGFTRWGAGTKLRLNDGCYNLIGPSSEPSDDGAEVDVEPRYRGIAFWAKTDARREPLKLHVSLPTADTDPDCERDARKLDNQLTALACNNAYGTDVTLTEEWKLYSVVWSDLRQDTTPARPFRLDRAVALGFTVATDVGKFRYWLDDVRFLREIPGGTGDLDGQAGSRCHDDTDCGRPLRCLTSQGKQYSGGGPPGGLCTRVCENDEECASAGKALACVPSGQNRSHCLERCAFDNGAHPERGAGAVKCHEREEFACAQVASGKTCAQSSDCPAGSSCSAGKCVQAVCVPSCNSDADCAPSGYCDTHSGVCVSQHPAGIGVTGEPCDSASCQGECLHLAGPGGQRVQTCADRCRVGATEACRNGDRRGFCLLGAGPAESVPGQGDLAFCAAACSCDKPCVNPALSCLALPSGAGRADEGYCGLGKAVLNCAASAKGALKPQKN